MCRAERGKAARMQAFEAVFPLNQNKDPIGLKANRIFMAGAEGLEPSTKVLEGDMVNDRRDQHPPAKLLHLP